jgi:hypothetical protein
MNFVAQHDLLIVIDAVLEMLAPGNKIKQNSSP